MTMLTSNPPLNGSQPAPPIPPIAPDDIEASVARPACRPDAMIDCGWGRLLYGPSFSSPTALARALLEEQLGKRDVALHVESPQLVLAEAPSNLFLDPSLIFRRKLDDSLPQVEPTPGILVRPLTTRADIAAINRLYKMRNMVPVDTRTVWTQRGSDAITYVVAEDENTGDVIGTAIGIDHVAAFGDVQGSSLWCLAVDPQTGVFGVGQALVTYLLAHFAALDRKYLELSVLHENEPAIGLYQKLGFEQVPGFVVKKKNAINEPLFSDTVPFDELNPYARILINEARRRGISVDVIDAEAGIFKLRYAGHEMLCRESLTELTGGVAMTWCQDKVLTLRRLSSVGLNVPRQRVAGDRDADIAFMRECGSVVVKPAMSEQGRGISMDVATEEELDRAVERAAKEGGHVVIEQLCAGQDLRIVVIGYKMVAAAIRRPAQVTGDGVSTLAQLIERQSARRAAATGGESKIPVDAETERCLAAQGYTYDSVPANGVVVPVRRTANLHTGGTIHDVTEQLHPTLRNAAETAARALHIPVTGLDFLVPSPEAEEYVIIEANERPGLANHEPQPTAQRFIDLLFPFTT